MIDITIKELKKSYFSGTIFENIDIELKSGERVGLLGENGVGKTTIFKIITGEETYQSGHLSLRNGLKIGYLKQIPDAHENMTVIDVLNLAFKELLAIESKIEALSTKMSQTIDEDTLHAMLAQLSTLQLNFEAKGGYEIREKLSKICLGLNFDDDFKMRPYMYLSGGEKTKVLLGKLLLEDPDVLLLDEPTNHLDIQTSEWLETYLQQFSGSVMIVSHDRYFLDHVVEKIFELKNGSVEIYNGTYSYYLTERKIRYESAKKIYETNQKKIAQLDEASKRMRDWGARADNPSMFKKARAIEKRIERLDTLERPVKDQNTMSMSFNSPSELGKIALEVTDFEMSIGEKCLLLGGNFKLINGSKTALIGKNGTGKTRLIKCLLEKDRPGVRLNPRAKIGLLEQDIRFKTESNTTSLTMIETYKSYHPLTDGEIRNTLARYQFKGETVFKKTLTLSGGERVRLMLAILIASDINFLMMDEPTNHIDIHTREILSSSIKSFNGTVLFVSHDRFFINEIADGVIEIDQNQLYYTGGNYDDYKIYKSKQRALQTTPNDKKEQKCTDPNINKSLKLAPKKQNNYKINQTLLDISKIETELQEIREALSENATDYKILNDLTEKANALENNWLELTELYYHLTE